MPVDFYRVHNLEQEEGRLTCGVSYNAAHPIFGGHFPGQPVVPGVCTMDMIKDLLEETFGKKLILRSTGQVKFLQLILPDVTPEVMVSWQEKEEGYAVSADLKNAGKSIFKMNAVYE